MSEEQLKLDSQRNIIDEQRTEIQKLRDLEASDVENFKQHKEIMAAIMANNEILRPIADTYKTVGQMAKWAMALLVFMSVLGGVILTWVKILNK